MRELPVIEKTHGIWQFTVDGEPFIAVGGEIHNSSASDPVYMDKVVWPALVELGANFVLAPVYWEMIEKKEGNFDFSSVDSLIEKARSLGMKLGLLWFGMWKGPDSLYIPRWMKKKLDNEDFQRSEDGQLIRQISPFSLKVFEADYRAYQEFMTHLKAIDEEEQTVIIIQVENEPGTWFHKRDYSPAAQQVFEAELPQEIKDEYGVSGSWQEAFPDDADDMFMKWIISKRINQLAKAGKEIYPLPTFTNCVPAMGFLHVAGGPSAENAEIWKKFAPYVDVLTPNVYAPNYEEIIDKYQMDSNALMVPETGVTIDCASKLLFTAGRGGLMFSPFGIEDIFPQPLGEYKIQLLGDPVSPMAGANLRDAYTMVKELYPELNQGLKEGRLHTILQRPGEKHNLPQAGFGGMVSFEGGDSRCIDIQNYRFTFHFGYTKEAENRPLGAAIVLEQGPDRFLFLGINLCMEIKAINEEEQVFIEDYRELVLRDKQLVEGRILSGDERNAFGAGLAVTAFTFELERHQ